MNNNTFVLTRVHEEYSKKNSQLFYELEFVTGWPLKTVKMYVSPENYNWRNWREYIINWNSQYAPVFRGLEYKDADSGTLNADRKPHYVISTDLLEFLNEVMLRGG